MTDKILKSFEVWIAAQGVKSRTRLRSVDNISLEGITRLRELILNLAVSGKLTQQISSDESAISLLNRILSEKKKLVEKGLLKEQKAFKEIDENEKPYNLPTDWCWTRLGNIGIGSTGRTPSTGNSSFFGGEIPFIGPGQISNQGEILISENTLTEEGSQQSTIADKGDILMVCIGGSIGKTAIVKSKVTFNQQINCIRPILVDSSYLNFVMNSSQFQFELREKSTGSATPIINRGKWEELFVSLPPLEEQHRIVAKVEELMALCDELEKQETNHLQSHALLVETLLGTLTQAKDASEFHQAWSLLAQHFDDLFTTEDSIDQLKQTILQLAVMGKLVPQDPKDEPASVLLERIKKEKERLVKNGTFKRQKDLENLGDNEMPFEAPLNWQWCRLQSLVYLLGDGLHGTPDYTPDTKYYFVNGNNLRNGEIVINPDTKTVSRDEMLKHKKDLTENAVLVSINGTLGNIAFYRGEEIMLGKSACYFNLSPSVSKLFIRKIIESNYFKNYALNNATGTTIKNLGLKAMNEFPICLPPLNEQKRIVSKVNELFALCDDLKARLAAAQTLANQLAEGVVA